MKLPRILLSPSTSVSWATSKWTQSYQACYNKSFWQIPGRLALGYTQKNYSDEICTTAAVTYPLRVGWSWEFQSTASSSGHLRFLWFNSKRTARLRKLYPILFVKGYRISLITKNIQHDMVLLYYHKLYKIIWTKQDNKIIYSISKSYSQFMTS